MDEEEITAGGWNLNSADLSDVEALLTAAMEHEIDGVAFQVLPEGYKVVVPDLEKHAAAPYRKRGRATFTELDSFIAYLRTHRIDGSEVFATSNDHCLLARINGHSNLEPGWGDHQALFSMRFTPSWTAWTGFANNNLSQIDFANFLEDRIGDIAEPPGADLFEMIRALRIHVNATWENVVNTQHNGVQFRWTEDVSTGDVVLPEKLSLVLAPFDGADPVEVVAKLRFKKPDAQGRVYFFFVLGEEVRRILDEAFAGICQRVGDETGVPVYRGSFASA